MDSPCDKTCTIVTGACVGCGRTLEEIRLWSASTETEQQQIVRLAKERIE